MYTEFEVGKLYRCINSETRTMMAGTVIFVVEVRTTNHELRPEKPDRFGWKSPSSYYNLTETVPSHDSLGYRQVTEVLVCDVDDMIKKPEAFILRNARWERL